MLADAIGQFRSADTLLAPGEVPPSVVGQSSFASVLVSDPTRDKLPGAPVLLAPSKPS